METDDILKNLGSIYSLGSECPTDGINCVYSILLDILLGRVNYLFESKESR